MNKSNNEVKINIASESPLQDGRCKLIVSFYSKSGRLRMDTGERCLLEHFDKARQRVNRKHPFQFETNKILDNLCSDLISTYKMFLSKNKIPSVTELKEAIRPKKDEDILSNKNMADYFDMFEKYQISQNLSTNTKGHYRTLQRTFAKYEREKKEKITLFSFDEVQHSRFIEWCIYEKENIPNTIMKRNGLMKTFFAYCERNGALVNPYYKILKSKTLNPEMIFLTEKELQKIENVEVDSYLEKTKDCFLFACYTGLRYSDIAALSLDHISENAGAYLINIYQEKTKKKLSIAMSEKAIEVMNKYKGSVLRNSKTKRLLPIVSNQKLNLYLKDLGQIAEINTPVEKITYVKGQVVKVIVPKYELLSFHKSRHTFATLSLQRGMPITVLQKILGHSRIEDTMIYAKVIDSFQHEQLLKVWNEEKIEDTTSNIISDTQTSEIDNTMSFEEAKNLLLETAKTESKEVKIQYNLSKQTIDKITQLGFSIKDTSPIEKLKGIFHLISW